MENRKLLNAIINKDKPLIVELMTQAKLNLPYECLSLAVNRGDIEIVKLLVGNKPLLTSVSFSYEPLSVLPIYNNDIKMLQYLIESGLSVNQTNINGITLLALAASRGHIEIAKLLIKYGAFLDGVPKKEDYKKIYHADNPLYAMIFYNNIQGVKILLELGANPNVLDYNENSLLVFADDNNRKEIVKIMQDRGAIKIYGEN